MNKKGKKTIQWAILFFIVIAILIAGWYYLRKQEAPAPNLRAVPEEKQPSAAKEEPRQTAESGLIHEKTGEQPNNKEDPCQEIEAQVREFFLVLDKQSYIKQIKPGIDSYEEFKKIVQKLSKSPPSPAGEGLDPRMMARNIFYFFRVLDDIDLRLIKEIIKHEEQTLEMNLVVFHKWLMLEDQCPDSDGIRPSFPIVYSFAGFFINTIGGRAYLFRRSPLLRQLVIYYALLIIHEADKRGENTYGIDIMPEIRSLAKEMNANTDLMLQQIYLEQLDKLMVYYQMKR